MELKGDEGSDISRVCGIPTQKVKHGSPTNFISFGGSHFGVMEFKVQTLSVFKQSGISAKKWLLCSCSFFFREFFFLSASSVVDVQILYLEYLLLTFV